MGINLQLLRPRCVRVSADCHVCPRRLVAHWARYRVDPVLDALMCASPVTGAPDYSRLQIPDKFSLKALLSWEDGLMDSQEADV